MEHGVFERLLAGIATGIMFFGALYKVYSTAKQHKDELDIVFDSIEEAVLAEGKYYEG
ncbi:hypothetical protein [Archaeoglobus veneficus]|uniref:Uncharacterized protein n=1 Tax=Archaeoglobus veneficus pleomorphic virus 1 TaxID=3115750 RepID=A0AAT9JH18_9VIRU|nr:hypothetical protein [Archaeoglobus veneficus]